ncbi:MAG: TlyA family RNA methyltransferase, partial [bacterium]|nr:TlyA family RNA methyltransferase [bacterium]
MPKDKMRLDLAMVEKGHAKSRESARGLIMNRQVSVDGTIIDKCGTSINIAAVITLTVPPNPYVSRGGLKLEKAIVELGLNVDSKLVLDIGASTGGFTDCALQHGAKKVIALDVGHGQLAWSLRQDERVFILEKTNIRQITTNSLPFVPDIFTVDVSFISLELVFP